MAIGFFIVKFDVVEDRRAILCSRFNWEDRYPLLAKPWHEGFDPTSKSFSHMPLWVRLPNLPLHLSLDLVLEVVGDAIGDFQMVDSKSSDILHTTYARILVVVDISKGLPKKINLEVPNGS